MRSPGWADVRSCFAWAPTSPTRIGRSRSGFLRLYDEITIGMGRSYLPVRMSSIGSSASEEAAFLALHPELADVVTDIAAIEEGPKRWLMRNAALMIYPSAHEGFGLVPFEAAEAGVVCAFAAQTSIAELLPSSLALIEQWDPDVTAAQIAPYLSSENLRAEHVAAVRAAAAALTWKQTARGLLEVYATTTRSRASELRRLVNQFVVERGELETTRDALKKLGGSLQ